MMVEDDDPKHSLGRSREQLGGPLQLPRADAAGLMPPGPDRVQADDEEAVGLVHGLRRLPVALELAKGPSEAGGERVRDVVVARNREERPFETVQERCRSVVLLGAAAVGEIAARDDQMGVDALDQRLERALDVRRLGGADMQV
jgi:hypothetical protein